MFAAHSALCGSDTKGELGWVTMPSAMGLRYDSSCADGGDFEGQAVGDFGEVFVEVLLVELEGLLQGLEVIVCQTQRNMEGMVSCDGCAGFESMLIRDTCWRILVSVWSL